MMAGGRHSRAYVMNDSVLSRTLPLNSSRRRVLPWMSATAKPWSNTLGAARAGGAAQATRSSSSAADLMLPCTGLQTLTLTPAYAQRPHGSRSWSELLVDGCKVGRAAAVASATAGTEGAEGKGSAKQICFESFWLAAMHSSGRT